MKRHELSTPQQALLRNSKPIKLLASPKRDFLAETLFIFMLCMVLFGLNIVAARKEALSTGEGDVFRQLVYGGIFVGLLLTSDSLKAAGRIHIPPSYVILPLAYCLTSAAWAIEPGATIRRLGLTALIIWSVFEAVRRVGFLRAVSVTEGVLSLAVFLSYAVVLLLPQEGIHQVADAADPGIVGSWRGILVQKNFAGAVCAVLILFLLFDISKKSTLWRWLVVLGSAYFLYRTNSKTSLGLLVGALLGGLAFSRYRVAYNSVALLGLAAVCLGALLTLSIYWDELTGILETKEAFTGRAQIWSVLLAYAQDNLLFGAGYGSFWNIGAQSPVFHYISSNSWISKIASGHNGYLDLLVQLGLPGLLLVVVSLIVVPIKAVLIEASLKPRERGLLFALLVFCVGHNFTESSLLDRDMMVEVFFMLSLAFLHAAKREHKDRFIRRLDDARSLFQSQSCGESP
ncbi:hypothetical protein C7U92_20405 [Bradyrhizobium sp. WBOS7]|uniref:O-antigen ligase-related domain-containing protein n=1 Tax=Bradyrhizobium betae TaxID=244734 RepID=A0AAE9N7C7_9BRAD|nr:MULTISPECIES: O-antigen ligase family protein [Bradyrhizobium]MDD1572969.1 hypothetical protein [Bradyrhizobium sp. WBOS1]UUO33169.1 hypothetical protein DCK84_00300 [Bradyrhizobium sp. WBOS01]MDD1529424.1 hypothetical protein [Bradyrhizobium sp. WBOS2]MDD1579058.1 hypothetical protein [Bradyrhizobium sp. WBOS7]MDD1601865.1 hypothetical protein [Bradyrhizobium sp. WBOS16]